MGNASRVFGLVLMAGMLQAQTPAPVSATDGYTPSVDGAGDAGGIVYPQRFRHGELCQRGGEFPFPVCEGERAGKDLDDIRSKYVSGLFSGCSLGRPSGVKSDGLISYFVIPTHRKSHFFLAASTYSKCSLWNGWNRPWTEATGKCITAPNIV
jgi:hypothetical protein